MSDINKHNSEQEKAYSKDIDQALLNLAKKSHAQVSQKIAQQDLLEDQPTLINKIGHKVLERVQKLTSTDLIKDEN